MARRRRKPLLKAPTGIHGVDEITSGGLPKGRPTLICGGPGCGKTVMAMEFICRGAIQFNEPGVFMAFEEKEKDLAENFASLGFDLPKLVKEKKIALDYVYIERSEIQETGLYDLEGIFVRLDAAIRSIRAKRVVLDTIEALFSGFTNASILRAELRRLFRWLKDKGVTAVITGEKGETLLTKYGLEEYVADCVIFLDHRVSSEIATRRMKIIKYRGSEHGTNEYPFVITRTGISVFPMTSLLLKSAGGSVRISSGIPSLDKELLGTKGFYKGSSILVSGTSGSGKTSVAAAFINSVCQAGERAIYFAFEESAEQLLRNMKTIGIDLQKWIDKGLLKIISNRATFYGLEMHLVTAHKEVELFHPAAVVLDPITPLTSIGMREEAKALMARLLDFLKQKGTTVLMTDYYSPEKDPMTSIDVSSVCDTWIKLWVSSEEERKRKIMVIKSRGMKHSLSIKNLIMTQQGLLVKDGDPGSEATFS